MPERKKIVIRPDLILVTIGLVILEGCVEPSDNRRGKVI